MLHCGSLFTSLFVLLFVVALASDKSDYAAVEKIVNGVKNTVARVSRVTVT